MKYKIKIPDWVHCQYPEFLVIIAFFKQFWFYFIQQEKGPY